MPPNVRARIAGENFRIVETIENSHDQDLSRLQIALSDLKTRPDFPQSFQRSKSLWSRLGCGRPDDMEQTGRMRSAATDVRRLKAAEGIQNEKGLSTFC